MKVPDSSREGCSAANGRAWCLFTSPKEAGIGVLASSPIEPLARTAAQLWEHSSCYSLKADVNEGLFVCSELVVSCY